MLRDHDFYKIQSALAAAGHLNDAELTQLEQHANTCASCHKYLTDMAAISRELFMLQTSRSETRGTPRGMHDRFLKRAADAGVAVTRSASSSYYPQAVRAAVIAILLGISCSLSWRVLSYQPAGTNAALESSTARAQSVPAAEAATPRTMKHAMQLRLAANSHLRRRPDAGHSETHQASSRRETPLFATQEPASRSFDIVPFSSTTSTATPLAALLLASARTPLPNAGPASCFGIGFDGKPEKRVCHLEIKLASLSTLGSADGFESESSPTSRRFTTPVFHLAPTRMQ